MTQIIPTQVYRNLRSRRQPKLSLRRSGRVTGHTCAAHLVPLPGEQHVRLVVSESGRQRVLKFQRKFVHAYVEGELWSQGELMLQPAPGAVLLRYNPFQQATFTRADTGESVTEARAVWIFADGRVLADLTTG